MRVTGSIILLSLVGWTEAFCHHPGKIPSLTFLGYGPYQSSSVLLQGRSTLTPSRSILTLQLATENANSDEVFTPSALDQSITTTTTTDTKESNKDSAASAATTVPPEELFNVQINDFFKKPVPRFAREQLDVYREPGPDFEKEFDVLSLLTAKPGSPAVPRPLWLVILGSVPTGILWYGYYKFCVEEELLQAEVAAGRTPRGFGGYGTLGPFVYGILLGPAAALLHLPGGLLWSNVGIFFIYYTQFLLYERLNEMYQQEGKEPPLTVWWCLPIFFPFDLIVGLRQVHFLSDYYYRQRGVAIPPKDPVVEFFPFIAADRFTWVDFVLTPSMWCRLLDKVEPFDRTKFPAIVQDLFELGDGVEREDKA